jgi:hypothetical protein
MLDGGADLPFRGTKEEQPPMRNMLIRLAAGAVGGAAATLLVNRGMKMSGKLPMKMRPLSPRRDPGDFMVSQAEKVVGPLSQKMHRRAVQGMPWLYGLSWPLGLAALSGVLGLRSPGRRVVAGVALGALVWLIGYEGWLPATGLLPPAHRTPLAQNATNLASHVAYGAVASLPLALIASRLED